MSEHQASCSCGDCQPDPIGERIAEQKQHEPISPGQSCYCANCERCERENERLRAKCDAAARYIEALRKSPASVRRDSTLFAEQLAAGVAYYELKPARLVASPEPQTTDAREQTP